MTPARPSEIDCRLFRKLGFAPTPAVSAVLKQAARKSLSVDELAAACDIKYGQCYAKVCLLEEVGLVSMRKIRNNLKRRKNIVVITGIGRRLLNTRKKAE